MKLHKIWAILTHFSKFDDFAGKIDPNSKNRGSLDVKL